MTKHEREITEEKIRLYEIQLCNPNLSETMIKKIENAMFFDTMMLLNKGETTSVPEDHGAVTNGLYVKNNSSPEWVWEKYLLAERQYNETRPEKHGKKFNNT